MGNFFKKITDTMEKAAAIPTTSVKVFAIDLLPLALPDLPLLVLIFPQCAVKPPAPNLLLPSMPWEAVWKDFEVKLVKLETQECSNKLRVENGADKVKDVCMTHHVALSASTRVRRPP